MTSAHAGNRNVDVVSKGQYCEGMTPSEETWNTNASGPAL